MLPVFLPIPATMPGSSIAIFIGQGIDALVVLGIALTYFAATTHNAL